MCAGKGEHFGIAKFLKRYIGKVLSLQIKIQKGGHYENQYTDGLGKRNCLAPKKKTRVPPEKLDAKPKRRMKKQINTGELASKAGAITK